MAINNTILNTDNKKGFVSTIILIVIAFILLKVFFDFDIIKYMEKYLNKDTILSIKNYLLDFYTLKIKPLLN
jgi:hypothetical protein